MNYLEMKKKALHLIVGKVKGFVRSVTGTPPISLEACADNASIIDYKIYGNSFQDGTPSPDNPIEVQSVGELVTDETDINYGKYKIPVTAQSKNLFDVDYYIYYNTEQQAIRGDTKFSDNFWKNEDGNGLTFKTLAYVGKYNNYPLTLKENTQYTLSFEAEWLSTDSRATVDVRFVYDDSTYKVVTVRFSDTKQKYTFTSGINKTLCSIQVYSWQYNGTCKMFNIQLEEGDTATDYEPYHEPITTNIYLDEPLRKVGDYADYIDFKNSMVVRNVLESMFTIGYRGVYKKLTNVVRLTYATQGFLPATKRDYAMLSVLLPYKYLAWDDDSENIFHHNYLTTNYYYSLSWNRLGLTYDGTNAYRIDDETQTALTDNEICTIAHNYLLSLPEEDRMLYMILNTPTQTSISLPILPTFKGITTVYEVGTTIQPSNMEAEYYSTLKGE